MTCRNGVEASHSPQPDRAAALAVVLADLDDLVASRRVALRGAVILAIATALALPVLLSLWGPAFISFCVLWVAGLASAAGRYIDVSWQLATRATELKAMLARLGHSGDHVLREYSRYV